MVPCVTNHTSCTGNAIGKGQRKKLARLFNQQKEKYERYLAQQATDAKADTDRNNGGNSGSAYAEASEETKSENGQPTSTETGASQHCDRGNLEPVLNEHDPGDARVARIIAGTFGNRQGLRVVADCGPFFHTFSC